MSERSLTILVVVAVILGHGLPRPVRAEVTGKLDVLKTVAANSVTGDSADRNKAARLKPKFQNGVNKEADLMTAVTDDSVRRSAAAIRSDRLKANALGRWEDDGGSPAMHHAIKGPHQ